MGNVKINDVYLLSIADAIREKNGAADKYKPSEMAAAIRSLNVTVTFTIDDGNPITVDSGTTWRQFVESGRTYIEIGYYDIWGDGEYYDDGNVYIESGGFYLCVCDRYGVPISADESIKSGDYYCCGFSIDGTYYEWNVNWHSGNGSWEDLLNSEWIEISNIAVIDGYVKNPADNTFLYDANGNKVKGTSYPEGMAFYLYTSPPENSGG